MYHSIQTASEQYLSLIMMIIAPLKNMMIIISSNITKKKGISNLRMPTSQYVLGKYISVG